MPELPEVETMRRGILGIVGSRILSLEWLRRPLKPLTSEPSRAVFRRRAIGQRISAVDRIGKRVVIRLESQDAIVVEPRMTGLVLLDEPPDELHLRWRMVLAGSVKHVWYWDRRGLGSVRLLKPDDLQEALGPGRLGPDALTVSAETLQEQFGASRRAIKVALLDQRCLAGIGNLYASEILHQAQIHPAVPCQRLKSGHWQRLQKCTHDVLQTAIAYEGSTLSDGTYRNALNQSGGYQNQHRVYARAGMDCITCRSAKIVRIVQAQRSTFFCPQCQKKRLPK